jgi:transposase-like protein
MKHYPPGFKADAVALYESRPESTIKQIAADQGVTPETLRNWIRNAGASRPQVVGQRSRRRFRWRRRLWRPRSLPCGGRTQS